MALMKIRPAAFQELALLGVKPRTGVVSSR